MDYFTFEVLEDKKCKPFNYKICHEYSIIEKDPPVYITSDYPPDEMEKILFFLQIRYEQFDPDYDLALDNKQVEELLLMFFDCKKDNERNPHFYLDMYWLRESKFVAGCNWRENALNSTNVFLKDGLLQKLEEYALLDFSIRI